MNRRNFLRSMLGGVAATAAVRTWPFRVFSFPKEVKIAEPPAVRIVKSYDPVQGKMITRLDVLVGFGGLYPETACRIIGLDDNELEYVLDHKLSEGIGWVHIGEAKKVGAPTLLRELWQAPGQVQFERSIL